MKEPPPEPKSRRLNLRTAIILAIAIVLFTAGFLALQSRQASRLRAIALETARRLAGEDRVGRALQHVHELLRSYPRDPEVLELKARLLAESARSLDQLLYAAAVNDQFLRAHPAAAGRPGGPAARGGALHPVRRPLPGQPVPPGWPERSVFNLRYGAAAAIAESLIARVRNDAGAHLLLARAGTAWPGAGGAKMVTEAIREYRVTLGLDPGNVKAAERLAILLNEQEHDPAGAVAVLDELMEHRPDSAEIRLVRHRFFVGLGRDDRATAEIEAAFRLAPDDPSACLEAADLALLGAGPRRPAGSSGGSRPPSATASASA